MNETEPIGYVIAHQMVETIFRQQLPALGMAVREGQIKLCHAMLNALYNKEVALCDAGVGLASAKPMRIWWPACSGRASGRGPYGSRS